jgi:hypothetical protein
MAAAIQTTLPPLETAASQSVRGVICVRPVDSNRAESSAVSTRCTTLDIISWLAPINAADHAGGADQPAPGRPAASSRRSTRSANCAASGSSRRSAKRRFQAALEIDLSHCRASLPKRRLGRRQSRL